MKSKEENNKIYYVCQWGNNKTRAWSGTYLSLMNGLKKKNNLVEISVKHRWTTRIKMILNTHTGIAKYGFAYEDIKGFNPWKHNLIPTENADILSFFEIDIPHKDRGYIYQDMCIDYIDNVILKDEVLARSFKKNVSRKIIKIREKDQKEYYTKCSAIFVMGEWLKRYLVNTMGIKKEKIHCVGAGYDVDIKKYDPSKRQGNKLLFVGIDFERKAGPLVIEAFKILKKKYQSNVQLYIVGPKFFTKKDSFEGIHYVGNVPGDKLPFYYNMCDAFCMPSYLEPFGKVYIEALAYGLPVVARNRFAAPDFIINGKNGFLIENDDAEILAEKMYEAINNTAIKEYVMKDMPYIRDYYSWDSVADRITEIIRKTADK